MYHQAGPAQRQAWLAVLAILACVYVYEQIKIPLENYSNPERRLYHANDLKHLYLGSRLLLRGESPYPAHQLHAEAFKVRHPEMVRLNPYVYPPFTGYLFGWLTLFSYDQVKMIWFWGSQVLLFLSLMLCWSKPVGCPLLPWLAVSLGTVAYFFPHFRSITAGQLNHFLLFLISLIFFLWRHGCRKTSGAVIGLATLVKVQPGFLLVWLCWKREWGAFLSAILAILLLIFGPAVRYGLYPYFDYLGVLKDMGYGSSTWSDQGAAFYVDPGNIGFPALLYRLFTTNPRTSPWLDLGGLAYFGSMVWALAVLALCLMCCRIRRRDEDPEMEMSAWLFGMLLIPSLFWDHYLVLLIPAWLTLISRLSQSGVGDGVMAVAACCWAICCWKFYWFGSESLHGLGMLYLNIPLIPVLILFGLCLLMARESHIRPGGEPSTL